MGRGQHNILPLRLDGFAAGTIDIQAKDASTRVSMRRERFDAEQAGAGLVRRIRLGNLSSCGSTAVLIGTSGRSNGRETHSMRQTQSVCIPQMKEAAATPTMAMRCAEATQLWREQRPTQQQKRSKSTTGEI